MLIPRKIEFSMMEGFGACKGWEYPYQLIATGDHYTLYDQSEWYGHVEDTGNAMWVPYQGKKRIGEMYFLTAQDAAVALIQHKYPSVIPIRPGKN